MARVCHFGQLESAMLTYKIVTSNKWPHLKSKMLTMADITAVKAVDLCRIEEITAKHAQVLLLDGKRDVQTLKSLESRKCKFCGKWHVFAKGSCPAYGKKCQKCGGKNHYKKVCRAENGSKKKSRKVKHVNDGSSSSSEEGDSQCSDIDDSDESHVDGEIGKIYDNSQSGGNVMAEIRLKVGKTWKKVKCELDTGANTSLIGREWLCKLIDDPEPQLLPSHYKLQAFGGSSITVLGQVKLLCKYKKKKYRLVLQVVDVNHRPLLSLRVCTTLGLIKFCNSVSVVPASSLTENSEEEVLKIYRIRAEAIVDKFADIFQCFGKMPGEVNLEIDANVPPVIQQPRRVPIALRNQLKFELDKLLENGIIAREYNHTDWFVTNVYLFLLSNNSLVQRQQTEDSESLPEPTQILLIDRVNCA
ncbi:uncharacterized protein LOC131686887 [Topomyia yanbarensis]|uniref:uncharacterized protein LOC131686887 n=1 Tax=Topomyia yanbarensis TaxID=2498891 RepID=UPI00273C5BED|nr:uncharacterized protein LOC131686887 [Topomyia yanbarensis]XP_058826883.1 uncharacterized protein LOC131686887 [Topomyia yanbarensis]